MTVECLGRLFDNQLTVGMTDFYAIQKKKEKLNAKSQAFLKFLTTTNLAVCKPHRKKTNNF